MNHKCILAHTVNTEDEKENEHKEARITDTNQIASKPPIPNLARQFKIER